VAEGLLVDLSPGQVDRLLDEVTSLSAPASRLGLTYRNREPGDQSAPAPALRRSVAPDDPAGCWPGAAGRPSWPAPARCSGRTAARCPPPGQLAGARHGPARC
jgi:hypothetical protein